MIDATETNSFLRRPALRCAGSMRCSFVLAPFQVAPSEWSEGSGQGEAVGPAAVCAFFQDAAYGLKSVVGGHGVSFEAGDEATQIGATRTQALAQRAANALDAGGILQAAQGLRAVVGNAADAVDGIGLRLWLWLAATLAAGLRHGASCARVRAGCCLAGGACCAAAADGAIIVHFEVATAAGIAKKRAG